MARPSSAQPGWFRFCLAAHRWTGLVVTPFFLVLCLTGSVLIFHEEIDRLLGYTPPSAAAPAQPVGLDALAQSALRQTPGKVMQSIVITPDAPDRAYVGVVSPGKRLFSDATLLLLDRSTAKPLPFANPDATPTGFLLKLHSQWLLDVPGEVLGSAIAVLVFMCLATGVAVYAPYVRRLAFGAIRNRRGARIVQLDLHNLLGVVVLGWLTVVTTTGICLGLGSILLGVWQNTELKEMAGGAGATTPAAVISVDRALASARAAMPDRDPQFAVYPNSEFSSPRHFTFLMYGRQPYNKALFDIVLVDAGTGRVAAARPLPWYLQIVVLAGPLHLGNYGGVLLKIFWVANAWAALFITGNGAWLWWSRRSRRLADDLEMEIVA